MKFKTSISFTIAVVLALITAKVGVDMMKKYGRGGTAGARVVVAKHDMEPGYVIDAEDIAKQVRDSIRDPGLIEEISMGCYEDSEPDDPRHPVERTQMLLRRREDVQSCSVRSVSSGLGIELFP